ncbi:hypothetical protein DERP_009774 [Dermatophagoides pteronyssinus]|uniref:Uncharacterized protein n=1 Tax=Dermatophagoides pteronyssinus TaxID=6956 RepID=A0ABQ8IR48_DERPT|nr:hypothetical protein DERP_009774 [Dermatophagoides pteronyssinus]
MFENFFHSFLVILLFILIIQFDYGQTIDVLDDNFTSVNNVTNNPQWKSCDTNRNCTQMKQFCFEGRCHCQPSYKWNPINGQCEYENCLKDPSVCQSVGRECQRLPLSSSSSWLNILPSNPIKYDCQCPDDQQEDQTGACRYKCQTDQDCQRKDSGSKCSRIESLCECPLNYHRSSNGSCERFECKYDEQCYRWDDLIDRQCQMGECHCNYDQDEFGRCTIYWYRLYRYRFDTGVHRIFLMTILIVPVVFIYCFFANFRRLQRSTSFQSINHRPNQYFPTANIHRFNEKIAREKHLTYYKNIENLAKIMKQKTPTTTTTINNNFE